MRIAVNGQQALNGDYYPSGNSNAVLATIAASLLTDQPTTIKHVPHAERTQQMLAVAEKLGATLTFDDDTLTIQTAHIPTRTLNYVLTSQFPASILLLAPIMARRRHVRLEWESALSRLFTHLTALQDLGQEIEIDGDVINIVGHTWDEESIILGETSVTATALVCMLAAVLGQKTIIYNAASEPHLRVLQHQLVQMGAKIDGIGSNLLTVYGMPDAPRGATVDLPADHVEIASISAIAALTPGQLSIHNVYKPDMQLILKVYQRLNVEYYLQADPVQDDLHILHIPDQNDTHATRRYVTGDITVDTAPWPGFPSDLIAIATVLATQTSGTTMIHEKLYNNRLLFIDKLKSMGAQILLCDPHRALVIGKSKLQGVYIDSPDVRTGLGILAATLTAQGKSTIDNAEVFQHVFVNVIAKLQDVNAQIKVVG